MCIFNEDDLYHIIKDKELFARFTLLERERRILKLHILKGFTFQMIAAMERVVPQRVHQIYARGLKKMKKQMLQMLKEQPGNQAAIMQPPPGGAFIGGRGQVWWG
jgi:DNA-directed RNA polymerase sigma subunit (sigma70/sigma32)